MKYKVYSFREFTKILRNNGYVTERMNGDHIIWSNGTNHITITAKDINPMIVRRLIKEYNLKIDE